MQQTGFLRTLITVLVLSLATLPAAAQGNSQGKGPPTNKGPGAKQERPSHDGRDTEERLLDAAFTALEVALIRDYFGENGYRTQSLPPGIAKNLARGKPLPPGIAKQAIPGDLRSRLPGRQGYERIVVGNDVLLVTAATGIIVDILRDAL
ncbi:anti-virulence regulator CigR family protein [Fodinicurvata halophila]|uniref:Anti-virulence regulator CigR family protein n=1 Tax=Fodinicurvata halophila TaxID=1419723 RepID=A0ABV8UJM7_9PROT